MVDLGTYSYLVIRDKLKYPNISLYYKYLVLSIKIRDRELD